VTMTPSAATEAQRVHGWSFGSEDQALLFDGVTQGELGGPPSPMTIDALVHDFMPKDTALRPFYVPTLFQSLKDASAAPPGAMPLAEAIRRIDGPTLRAANALGRAVAAERAASPTRTMLVIDLPGPESVAFAAGVSRAFEP